MAASFVVDKTNGVIPYYIRLTDTSTISGYTSATDYTRIWSITNVRTSGIQWFQTTSASINCAISGDSIFNDTYTVSLSAVF